MFQGCFIKGYKGPYYIQQLEPKKERIENNKAFNRINKKLELIARKAFNTTKRLKDFNYKDKRKGKLATFTNFYKKSNTLGFKLLERYSDSINSQRY